MLEKFDEKAVKRKFFNRMLMTLSDQIAGFSVEISDENISGCKSILCRFCLLSFANILRCCPYRCRCIRNTIFSKLNTNSTRKL